MGTEQTSYTYRSGQVKMIVENPTVSSLFAGGIITKANRAELTKENFFAEPIINANDIKINANAGGKKINNFADVLQYITDNHDNIIGKRTENAGEIFNAATDANMDAHAEGRGTDASGDASHAEGVENIAHGDYSHAEGYGTTTFNQAEHAEGKFNISASIENPEIKTISSVGIGANWNDRKNAQEVLSNGDFYVYGIGNYKGQVLNKISDNGRGIGNKLNVEPIQSVINNLKNKPGEKTIDNGEIFNNYSNIDNEGKIDSIFQFELNLELIKNYAPFKPYADFYLLNFKQLEDYLAIPGVTVFYEGMDSIFPATAKKYKLIKNLDTPKENQIRIEAESIDEIISFVGNINTTIPYCIINANSAKLNAHAEGNYTMALGNASHAEGNFTKVYNNFSHAEGSYTVANGQSCHAEGISTFADGEASHVEGSLNYANSYAHAEGYHTNANSKYSHAEGYSCITKYINPIINSFTTDTNIKFIWSNSENIWKSTTGETCKNFKYFNKLNNELVHQQIYNITNINYPDNFLINYKDYECMYNSNTAFGTIIKSESINSIDVTNYKGNYAHAEGYYTITTNDAEHAEGKFNISNNGTLSSIGYGTSLNNRKNAIEVLNNGLVYINGVGKYNGENLNNAKSLQESINVSFVGEKTKEDGEIFNVINKIINLPDFIIYLDPDNPWNPDEMCLYALIKKEIGNKYNNLFKAYDYKFVCDGYNYTFEYSGDDTKDCYGIEIVNDDYNGDDQSCEKLNYNLDHGLNISINVVNKNIATGIFSHAEGKNTNAINIGEHAEGIFNKSNKDLTLSSIGYGTSEYDKKNAVEVTINGLSYFSGIGNYNGKNITNAKSLQEVVNNKSDVGQLTKEGGEIFNNYGSNIASSSFAHAEGENTHAEGYASHTEGINTTTTNFGEHAEGHHNVSHSGKTISSIGIGDTETGHKNAVEVLNYSGLVYINGIGNYDGTNLESTKSLQDVIKSLLKMQSSLNTDLEKTKVNLDTSIDNLRTATTEMTALKNNYNTLQNNYNTLSTNYDQLQIKFNNLNKNYELQKANIVALQGDVKSIKDNVKVMK